MSTAIYTRVSTIEQAKTGHGLEEQKRQCHALAEAKGWEISREFTDEGISGTKGVEDRPGLAALVEAIESGEIDTVIVSSLDRIARDAVILLNLTRNEFEDIALISNKESLDTSSASGVLFVTILAGFAEFEKDKIVERLTEGRNARQRIDGERGGPLPLGYVRNGSGVEIDENEAELVKQIFKMRQNGAILQGIADYLNERGITSKQGGKWYPSTVKQILSQEEKYRGGFRKLSPVYWPEILEE